MVTLLMIILISGKAGSGKSRIASELCDRLPNTIIVKFAEPLYSAHNTLLELLRRDGINIPQNLIHRPILVALGQLGREINPNTWVDIAKKKIYTHEGNSIVDDLRFPNELNAFPDAFKIRLEASQECRDKRAGKPIKHDDVTETGLDHIPMDCWDVVLNTEQCTIKDNVTHVLKTLEKWQANRAVHES